MKLSKALLMIALIAVASEAAFAQRARSRTTRERTERTERRNTETGRTAGQAAVELNAESTARKTQIESAMREANVDVANNSASFNATVITEISKSAEKTNLALELVKDRNLDRATVMSLFRLISLDKARSTEISATQLKAVLAEYKTSENATREVKKIINGAAFIVDKGMLPEQVRSLFEVSNGQVSVKLLEGLSVDAKVKEVITGELNTKRAMMLSFLALKVKEGKTMEQALDILKQLIEKNCFG